MEVSVITVFETRWRTGKGRGMTFPGTGRAGQLRRIAMIAVLAWSLPSLVCAQKVPVGPEFEVNTYTTETQGYWGPRISSDPAGNFVVVWANYDGPLYASRFGSDGVPIGSEIQFSDDGARPAVASDATGGFVVVWDTYYCDDSYGMCARRFDSSGTPVGPEFRVDTGLTEYAYQPKVASDATGNFVVVWAGFSYEPYGSAVMARRFDSTGSARDATEFRVALCESSCAYTFREDQDGLEVASDAAGNFMVVWNTGTSVFGRAYDSAGVATGPEFEIYSSGADYSEVGIAADGAGHFIAVWDANAAPIRGQRFDSAGTPVGTDFQVSEPGAFYPYEPRIAADATGNFVVVWTEYEGDGSGPGVIGRQFDSTGTAVGSDFQVNTYTYYHQNYPAVASAANGDFVVVWQSRYQDADYSAGVFGQRFGEPGATTTTTTMSTTTTTLPSGCAPVPMAGCRQQTMARRGGLTLKDKSPDTRDRLRWKWVRGSKTDPEDFGDPLDEANEYALCVYDASENPQPLFQQVIPGGGGCPGRPCWKQVAPKRFDYRNRGDGSLLKVFLKAAEEGRARVGVIGRGDVVEMPQLPLVPPVTVQFQASNGQCWEARYNALIRKNEGEIFRAKPGSPSAAFLEMTGAVLDCPRS